MGIQYNSYHLKGGVSKEKVKLSYWAKNIAPSTELRQQFHHNQCSREQFKQLYYAELDANKEALNLEKSVERGIIVQDIGFTVLSKNFSFTHG